MYCPNCQQMVSPHSPLKPTAWLLGIAVWVGTGLTIGIAFGVSHGLVALALGVIVARAWGPRYHFCPLCKSEILQRQAPTQSSEQT